MAVHDLLPQEMWQIIFTYSDIDSLSTLATACIEIRKSIDLYLFKNPLYIMTLTWDKTPCKINNISVNFIMNWKFTGSYHCGYNFYDIIGKKIFKKLKVGLTVVNIKEQAIVFNIANELNAKKFIHIFSSVSDIDQLRKHKRILNLEVKVLSDDYTQRRAEIMHYINTVPIYKPAV